MIRDIIHIGHPTLRLDTEPVRPEEIRTERIQSLIDDLIDTKRDANGAGIAAPQIDVPLRVFIVEVANNPRYPYKPETPLTVVINPTITFLTDKRYGNYEGCLSIPDLRGVVPRCPHIRVEALDRDGKPFVREVKGITAGTFQHENDHLNGVLFPDRVEDTHTLSTWAEFKARHEAGVAEKVRAIVERWGE